MDKKELYDKAFVTAFGLDASVKLEDLKYQGIEAWDSVGHMALVSELEDAFDIMMDTDDIIDFSSYLVGIDILKKYDVEI